MPAPDTTPETSPAPAQSATPGGMPRGRRAVGLVVGAAMFATMLGFTTWRAFERDSQPPALAAIEPTSPTISAAGVSPDDAGESSVQSGTRILPVGITSAPIAAVSSATAPVTIHPSQTRSANIIVDGQPWTGPTFDGRPIRPVRTVTMRTTAYSPDEQSCGVWADGITASGMSVWTNGMKLAAADPSLPFGTILTVPGYNDGQPIPVLDRGGAIKGNRLDLLYPTHDIARQWGVQDLEVVVWEYADE